MSVRNRYIKKPRRIQRSTGLRILTVYTIFIIVGAAVITATPFLLNIFGIKVSNSSNSINQPAYTTYIVFFISFLTLVGVIFTTVSTLRINRKSDKQLQQQQSLRDTLRLTNQQDKSAADKRRDRFISLSSITLHYANHDQIEDLYNQVFKEPVIEKLVAETTGETGETIKGHLPQNIIEAGIDNKDTNKWTSNFKVPDLPLSGKFLGIQRENIKQNQVNLGLEEVDIQLSELNAFQELVDKLTKGYGLKVEQADIDEVKSQLKEKAAERTLRKLEDANGWILIEGKFKILKDVDSYRFSYPHPVNDYISRNTHPVTFFVSIPINSLQEGVKSNYALSVGSLIPLKIYGQVWRPIDRGLDTWDLQINALAIYQ